MYIGLVAQWIRRLTSNQLIAGSNPVQVKLFSFFQCAGILTRENIYRFGSLVVKAIPGQTTILKILLVLI